MHANNYKTQTSHITNRMFAQNTQPFKHLAVEMMIIHQTTSQNHYVFQQIELT